MNKLIYIAVLLLIVSCNSDDDSSENQLSTLTNLDSEIGLSYAESIDAWNELKNTRGNSYNYQTTITSFSGFGSTTELQVRNGVTTTRVYQEFSTDVATGEQEIIDAYTETGSELGNNVKGATPLTIDQLYASCAADFLVIDPSTNTVYFQTDVSGLMTLCGFVPDNCQDDCYEGIRINAFDWVNE